MFKSFLRCTFWKNKKDFLIFSRLYTCKIKKSSRYFHYAKYSRNEKIMYIFVLSMEETIRPSHFGFIYTAFCRVFHSESSEKKSEFYHLSMQRYSQNKICFFENPIFQKTCFTFFSERGFRRSISSVAPSQYNIKSNIFFVWKLVSRASLPRGPFFQISLFIII